MNLGNFVGGAVQGYNVQERANQARQEMEASNGFRERQMKMAEEDQAAQNETRNRDKSMREKSAALFSKYYGEKQETVAQTQSEDGQGGVATVPTVKTTRVTPGMDSALDNKWAMENAMIIAEHSGMSTEEMGKIASHYEVQRQTTAGRALDRVLAGDEAAMSAFLIGIGKDPKGAKLDNRPVDGVRQIILADGSKFDLRGAYQTTALAARYKQLIEEESVAQKLVHDKATVRNLNSQADLHTAQAGEAPAKGKLLAAQTNLANAQAGLVGVKAKNLGTGGGGGASTASKTVIAKVKALTERDPTSLDGKGPNQDMASYLFNRSEQLRREGKQGEDQSVSSALAEWKQVDAAASKWASSLATMSPKDRKAKYGMSDIAAIKAEAIRRKLGTVGPTAAPRAADTTDDTEN